MRCHYVQDKIAGKVLIPGCMAVAVSNDKEDCTCNPVKRSAKNYQPLFDLMSEEHNLTLTISEMNDIMDKVEEVKRNIYG